MLIPDAALPDLPIRPVLPRLRESLAAAGASVLVAPPGTGKTTLVPLALADSDGSVVGRVVVAEPRRLAARAAARRMAWLLGEQVGARVGFSVRGERRVSRHTLVEVVTTGVLVRRLQRDPELAGTAVVMVDECHERHLDTDLALAFLLEVRSALRPDLRLVAASATADTSVLGEVPVVRAEARLFPVEVHWAPPPGPISPPLGLRVDPKLLDHVASVVRRALAEGSGDVLVFLPGAREIDAVAGRLGGTVEVLALHGRQPSSIQDAALRPGTRRRVVLATAVAESSLTVPGVRSVVDAGLSRVPRMDHARGLGALVTVPMSRAAATQRAGRAGREGPGRVYRCWSAAQHDRLPAQPEPEIAAADLTGFALDLALWGHPDGTGLALPDRPPPGALQAAVTTLHDLGAVDGDGRITSRGRALADAGLHPRLARALLDGAPVVGARRAAEIVALLDDDRATSDDLVAAWRRARSANEPSWRTEVRRLTAALSRSSAADSGDARAGDPTTDVEVPDIADAASADEDNDTRDENGDGNRDHDETRDHDGDGNHDRDGNRDHDDARDRADNGDDNTNRDREGAGDRDGYGNHDRDASREPDRVGNRDRNRAGGRDQGGDGGRGRGGDGGRGRGGDGGRGRGGDGGGGRGGDDAAGRGREGAGAVPNATPPGSARGRDDAGSRWVPDDLAAGLIVGMAYPERVARVREAGGRAYLMAGGTAAELGPGSGLAGVAWLAVASADRAAGARTARVRAAAPLDEATAVEAAGAMLAESTEIGWVDGEVVARSVRRLGAITLVERRINDPDPGMVRAALLEGLRRDGLGLLTWSRSAVELRERMAFAHAALGEPWPDVGDEALLERAYDWLGLGSARRRADLAKLDVASGLRRLLPWSVAGRLDEVAPERLPVPSGSRVRVDYSDSAAPVLAVKVQEAFGWKDAPRLADGRVPVLLHLLSPAGRPVAVTRDLASFWQQGYPQVRAELRGRYPRHPWPEDPTTAEPTRRTNPRSR
ncbi:ATP-dependent helicase C-terminal domain-containing protein [Paractinoplanes globisporus]|uniref:ATP-dependent helicase C-terminal domain-containing protein n=1 Tax=Paractinoplanes globisporus TaxID=113565 RepID=A0ABW6WMT8_9ACTN|nr:ATP-dependent helicase C-terminal domain-containing protein [Actinoplanes globisporus]